MALTFMPMLADPGTIIAGAIIGLIGMGISTVAGLLTAKKAPSNPFDTTAPTLTTRGSYLPVLLGTQRIGPVIGWVGDRKAAQQSSGGGSFGGGGASQTTYYESAWHMLACGPIDRLDAVVMSGVTIFEGPISPADTPSGSTLTCANGEGSFQIYWGERDQPVSFYLADATRVGVASRWPRVTYILWNQKRLGGSATWPIIEYQVAGKVLDAGFSAFTGELADTGSGNDGINPAFAIYQMLTGCSPWGAGLPPAAVDSGALTALGDLLATEHLPVNASIDSGQLVVDVLTDLLAEFGFLVPQVGDVLCPTAVRYVDPATLPTLPDGLVQAPDLERGQIHDTTIGDRIVYTFENRANAFQPMDVAVDDDATARALGRSNARSVQLKFTIDGASASAIAQRRMLEDYAQPVQYALLVTREARLLRPGQAFIVADLGQLRVASVDYDTENATGKITATLDQYSQQATGYLPAYLLAEYAGGTLAPAADLKDVIVQLPTNETGGNVAITVLRVRAHQQILGAHVWLSADGTNYQLGGRMDAACAHGTLDGAIAATDASPIATGPQITPDTADIYQVQDLSSDTASWTAGVQVCALVAAGGAIEITWLEQVALDVSGWTLEGIIRAQEGTTAHDFAVGDEAYIIARENVGGLAHPLIASGVLVYVKVQPFTATGSVDLASLAALTFTPV